MMLGYLYNNLNFPKELIHKTLEFVGNDELTNAIKSTNIRMLNNKVVKFYLIRTNQIKLPIDAIFSNDINNNHDNHDNNDNNDDQNLSDDKYLLKQIKIPTDFVHIHINFLDYNNSEFVFETPFIKLITYKKALTITNGTKLILPIGVNKLNFNLKNSIHYNLWNNDEYNKLDYLENNLFLSFLLKFENQIFTQICKSNDLTYKKIKFISCVKAKKIPIKKMSINNIMNKTNNINIVDNVSNINDVDENNVKGYTYEIKLKNYNTDYYLIRTIHNVKKIKKIYVNEINVIRDTMIQSVKFELKPYFILFGETIHIGFNITKCFLHLD